MKINNCIDLGGFIKTSSFQNNLTILKYIPIQCIMYIYFFNLKKIVLYHTQEKPEFDRYRPRLFT